MSDAPPTGDARPGPIDGADTEFDDVDAGGVDVDDLDDDLLTAAAFDPLARPTGWRNSRYLLFTEMLVFAILSLLAAWVLSYDAILLAGNPDANLACDINSVISCGKVADAWQAKVFGFPNAFLGMVAEPVVMTIAVASLAGTRFPRWFMFTANAVYFLAVVFAYWLLSQSMFDINALCPWCLLVTLATTLVFASMLHWNILENNLYLSEKWQARALSLVRSGAFTILVAAWVIVVIAAIVFKYGASLVG